MFIIIPLLEMEDISEMEAFWNTYCYANKTQFDPLPCITMYVVQSYQKDGYNICMRVEQNWWKTGVCSLPCHNMHFIFDTIVCFYL